MFTPHITDYPSRDTLRELYLQRHRRWEENLKDRPLPDLPSNETKVSMKKRLLETL